MGGSGGGGGSSSKNSSVKSGGAIREQQSCDNLIFDTQLKSPNEKVIKLLTIGDILPIKVNASGECFAIYKGAVAGTIVCAELKALLNCISEGNAYVAEVKNLFSIRCTVTIKQLP